MTTTTESGTSEGNGPPDSAERTVIASDLSNLPPGQAAVDPRTGQRSEKDQDEDEEPPGS